MHSLDGKTGNFSVNFIAVRIQLHLSYAVSPSELEPALNTLKDWFCIQTGQLSSHFAQVD